MKNTCQYFLFIFFAAWNTFAFGQIEQLATNLSLPYHVVVDNGFVYYDQDDWGVISKMNVNNTVEKEQVLEQSCYSGMLVDNGFLYNAYYDGVSRIGIDGVQPDTVQTLPITGNIKGIAIHHNTLYYGVGRNLYQFDLTDIEGTPKLIYDSLAPSGLNTFKFYKDELYINNRARETYKGSVYKLDLFSENISKTVLVDSLSYPRGLAFHNDVLYYSANGRKSAIMQVNLLSEELTAEIFMDFGDWGPIMSGLDYADGFLYFAMGGDGDGEVSRVGVTSNISLLDQKNPVVLFPNPTTDYLEVKNVEIGTECRIFNSIGELVLQQKVDGLLQIGNFSQLPNGIYYLQIAEKERLKFVISK